MKKYAIRKSNKQGNGVFAVKDIKKDEKIMDVDLGKLRSHTLKEWEKIAGNSSHMDYVGNGRYVISHHVYSYINYTCS